ncbi:hypothetical protein BP6252_03435 [Coleophoma cylindrospora]|uniref:C6 zinc finger protein n=1 Tax=Coleophoma cylindrospora TaxID=1849047 RepID=A0A3D8S7P3_9HELO|nr:hypothetical protein BP6252_03435 [Coleophoma cylindrospora]
MDCPSPPNSESSMVLNLADLELLHNYTTSTVSTITFDPMLRDLWRINVPQLGFEYGFVMRGILAVSALHLAYNKPAKREYYLNLAMHQHQTALRDGIAIVSSVNEENCPAVYIFSILTFLFTLGSPKKADNFLLIESSGVADWLYLLRGTRLIIESCRGSLSDSIIGPMFQIGFRRMAQQENVAGIEQLKEFRQYATNASTDSEALAVYLQAVDELDRCFALLYHSQIQYVETAHIFAWTFQVSDAFLQLLKEGTQEALAIFAYGCVLMKHLDCHWWMDGWSRHLISRIFYLLDEEHRLWIRWPIEEIGWVPGRDASDMVR